MLTMMKSKREFCYVVFCLDIRHGWTVWADTEDEAKMLARAFGHSPFAAYRN